MRTPPGDGVNRPRPLDGDARLHLERNALDAAHGDRGISSRAARPVSEPPILQPPPARNREIITGWPVQPRAHRSRPASWVASRQSMQGLDGGLAAGPRAPETSMASLEPRKRRIGFVDAIIASRCRPSQSDGRQAMRSLSSWLSTEPETPRLEAQRLARRIRPAADGRWSSADVAVNARHAADGRQVVRSSTGAPRERRMLRVLPGDDPGYFRECGRRLRRLTRWPAPWLPGFQPKLKQMIRPPRRRGTRLFRVDERGPVC